MSAFILDPDSKSPLDFISYNNGNVNFLSDIFMTNGFTVLGKRDIAWLVLSDTNTSYTLNDNDMGLLVLSNTYLNINLPSALNRGGAEYFIANKTNHKININSDTTDTIDDFNIVQLRPNNHMHFTSDGIARWLIN